MLTRLNRCKDRHLVKLLLTMEILGRPGKDSSFFLIFPLADCNLRQFWQDRFPHPEGTSTATYSRWVAHQLYGLALALCKLHNLHEREVHTLKDREAENERSDDPFYGIHGDIKPANLLWYQEWVGLEGQHTLQNEVEGSEVQGQGHTKSKRPLVEDFETPQELGKPLGVLQLADFGISRLHHTNSRSDVNMRRGTKTYAPPEVEWGFPGCSRSFDIWSLGCVFLEFICWLVQGGSGEENPIEAFHENRYLKDASNSRGRNRSLEGTAQDTFYHVVKGKDTTKFEVNPAVKEVITQPQL